jgi:hypothetical protein
LRLFSFINEIHGIRKKERKRKGRQGERNVSAIRRATHSRME